MVNPGTAEAVLFLCATIAYVVAMALAISSVWRQTILGLLAVGVVLMTAGIAVRWATFGYGPFTTLYEVLASSVWSLSLVYAIVYAAMPQVRGSASLVLPFIVLLAGWMLSSDCTQGHLPPTFDTPLLYVHSLFGKLFLSLLMIATALGAIVLARRTVVSTAFEDMADDGRLTELSYRFAAFAFVSDTIMLIVGAIWAQDAWGRYWAWDPLETWAFLTWLALAFALHLKIWLRPPALVWSGIVATAFALAFLTFFGVPFVSDVPHKGVF
jgi:ABC-type transport system involved in cytochrome c biogenesis permease subunit